MIFRELLDQSRVERDITDVSSLDVSTLLYVTQRPAMVYIVLSVNRSNQIKS